MGVTARARWSRATSSKSGHGDSFDGLRKASAYPSDAAIADAQLQDAPMRAPQHDVVPLKTRLEWVHALASWTIVRGDRTGLP